MASETVKTPEHIHAEQNVPNRLAGNPIYAFLLTPIRITAAWKGHVVARLPLTENHINSHGSLHGSVSATIVDWMGGTAIASYDLRSSTGVSIDIHVTFQAGAGAGSEIEIEGVAERVGGSIAFTRVAIYKVEEEKRGKLLITGTHTKYVKGSQPRNT